MSPLKIILLLNLYSRPRPLMDYPQRQREAPAMREAFSDFSQQGILVEGIDHAHVSVYENFARNLPLEGVLTEKGQALVQRLLAVEP